MISKSLLLSALFFSLSFALYVLAPDIYSYEFCFSLLLLYLVILFWFINYISYTNNFFNFHLLFLISFLFVNFIYPSILFPIDPNYFPVFKKTFDYNVISKSTALAFLGFSSYQFGAVFRKNTIKILQDDMLFKKNYIVVEKILTPIILGSVILLIIIGGPSLLQGVFLSTKVIPPGLLVFVQVILGLGVIVFFYNQLLNARVFEMSIKYNKLLFFTVFLFSFIFIYTGDRGPAIQIGLIVMGAFSLSVRSIRLKEFLVVFLVGMFIMTFISFARSKDIESGNSGLIGLVNRGIDRTEVNSFFDLGMDLIVNNRNLFVSYQYANEYGFNYGSSSFYYIFSPIPFLPSFFAQQFYGISPSELTSASIITQEAESTYGLGTNIIGDLYMSWGAYGVVSFMFALGFIVCHFHTRVIFNLNIFYFIVYIFLLGFSIYLPRTVVFEPLRHVFWAVIFFSFIVYLIRNLK